MNNVYSFDEIIESRGGVMESYWFISFIIYYNEGCVTQSIKGDAVVKLSSQKFLPGTVKRIIVDNLAKQTTSLQNGNYFWHTQCVVETDKNGLDDFQCPSGDSDYYLSMQARDFKNLSICLRS